MSEDAPPPEPEAAPPSPDDASSDAATTDSAASDGKPAPVDGKPAPLAGGGTALPPRSLRLPILGAIAIVVVLAVVVIVARGRRHRDPGADPDPGSAGGAAISAPAGPTLPDQPTSGVRLTGFVIDGAGIPVAGAEVSAELEKGAPDRALAPPTRAGGGTGLGATGNGIGNGNGNGTGAGNGTGIGNGNGNGTGVGNRNGIGNGIGTGTGNGTGIGSGAANGSGTGVGSGSAAPPKIVVAPATSADGRFVVDGLEPGRYRVRVTGAGLLPAEVRFVPVPSDATRILVSRQISIEGLVTDGGKPAPNITVAVRGDAIGGELDMTSGADGKFTFSNLPEGRYQVFAWQGSLAARALRVSRLGAGPFSPVELRLEPAAIVVGRVIDRDEGTGIAAAIELRPSGDDQAPRYARSGPDGAFKIEGVPDGTWIADAFSPGYVSPGGVELAAGRGITELALGRGATIEGRVVDAEGKPIAGAEVRAITAGTSPVETSAAVDQDRLRRFSGRMAAPVVAECEPEGPIGAHPARQATGVMVDPIRRCRRRRAWVALSAVVDPISSVGLAGEPAPLAVDPARASVWVMGQDGVYRIRGLGRGKVSVLAVAPGYAEGRSKEREVESGQTLTKMDVVLSPGTFLVGKVTDQHGVPVIGAQVTASLRSRRAHRRVHRRGGRLSDRPPRRQDRSPRDRVRSRRSEPHPRSRAGSRRRRRRADRGSGALGGGRDLSAVLDDGQGSGLCDDRDHQRLRRWSPRGGRHRRDVHDRCLARRRAQDPRAAPRLSDARLRRDRRGWQAAHAAAWLPSGARWKVRPSKRRAARP